MKLETTSDVLDGLSAYVVSAALGAALETGLFWLLDEQRPDEEGVAQALNIPLKRCRYWLGILHRVGLLEPLGAGYAPSDGARAAILEAYSRDFWAYLAQEELAKLPTVYDLTRRLPEPGPAMSAPPGYVEKMAADPEQARRFTQMLYELHQSLAERVAEALDLTGVQRLLDLGGGSGVVSLALLRRHPQMAATVVDIENVCAAGREIARENGLAERITYQAADFVHGDLPGRYDLALYCDVGVYTEDVFRKVWAALNPGGRLAIIDEFAPAGGAAPAGRLFWLFQDSLADPEAEFPTAAGVTAMLSRAGFQSFTVQPIPGSLRVILQASKD